MRTVLTLAAAAVINLAALAALEWNVTQAQLPPAGEVTITQIEEPTPLAPLAQVQVERQVARTRSL
ncbi:hypothetical protein [Steroidobacter sp.]|uniref:hypothetical protein n=1 Tax=Steroidobacter sp. TaxID=1978227 RepID=UPI001A39B1CB|nr:hypothetical protein [Steroidobacter sp.]MBL8268118.1 hypothetical protein [Steroidobacter sp.]